MNTAKTIILFVIIGLALNSISFGMNGIHEAARAGHFDRVQQILQADPNAANVQGGRYQSTPLHFAASEGQVGVAQLLLDHGAAVDGRNEWQVTPLHFAAMEGQGAVAQLLLDRGAAIDARDCGQRTPLHFAAEKGQDAVAQLLLDRGAAIDVKNFLGSTPLCVAAGKGHLALVRVLLEHRAAVDGPDPHQRTPLFVAGSNGHNDVVLLLLQNKADVNAPGLNHCTPLHEAVRVGKYNVVRTLLLHGANPNARDCEGGTPLHCAAVDAGGNTHISGTVLPLLQHRADINATDNHQMTPLGRVRHQHTVGPYYSVSIRFLEDWPLYQQFIRRNALAFCMATQPRLGEHAPVRVLDPILRRLIFMMACPSHTLEEIHQIVEQERRNQPGQLSSLLNSVVRGIRNYTKL